jgi:UDP-2,3-diacylglucosamine pyrophosphatase LpxH
MKTKPTLPVLAFIAILFAGPFMHSCKKSETPPEPVYLSVTLPAVTLENEQYYSLTSNMRSVELEFSEALDTATIRGALSLSDKSGNLDQNYSLLAMDRKVVLEFLPGFSLKKGWRYLLTLGAGIRSVSGNSMAGPTTLEFRTSTLDLFLGGNAAKRDALLCLSDIHMGEYRAVTGNYCWFSKNDEALTDLLDWALNSGEVREVVIMGDLFDGWIIPYRTSPFDASSGVTDISGYFHSIASSPVNVPVIDKFKAIATSDSVKLVYIPGNHDMLLTQEILQDIIPGVIWKGTVSGMGDYSPVEEMVMEHGHRYDFFNAPQPLVNSGHILPPGFFISRLQAAGLQENQGGKVKEGHGTEGSIEFLLAWTVAYEFVRTQYKMTVYPDSLNIRMGGIDGYSNNFSFNGARDMYAANIENNWESTQTINQVPVHIPVLMAILDGNMDMYAAATYEYMSGSAPKKYRMAVFGHTHRPELILYPTPKFPTGLYANSGSWVNAELSSKPVRSYLLIRPAAWTGSDLDVASLYQYNSDGGKSGLGYSPTLLDEESIYVGK